MAFSKNIVFEIFNNFRDRIVNLDTKNGRDELRKFIYPDPDGRKDNIFVRKSPVSCSLLLEYLIRHTPLSTQTNIDVFFDEAGLRPVTKSAISQRRTRLDPQIFVQLNRKFVSECYKTGGADQRSWNGYYLMAADGSQFALHDKEVLGEDFGSSNYANHAVEEGLTCPMAKCVMISDMLNGFTLCSRLFKHNVDERVAFEPLLDEFANVNPFRPHETICILDRGYFSLKIMYLMGKLELKYVIRVSSSSSIIREFIKSGKGEEVVEWRPSSGTSLFEDSQWREEGRPPLKVRLVAVKLKNGETEVLVTNLTSEEVSHSQMKELYFKRWGIEVDYLHYKYVYEIEGFTGARPVCVYQDFYATVLLHNMVCLVIDSQKENVEKKTSHRKLAYKTNCALLAGAFFNSFVDMFVRGHIKEKLEILNIDAIQYLTPVRPDRCFPRERVKYKKGYSHRTKTNRKRAI